MGAHPGIFISYRRHDSAGHAGRLFDCLAARFGGERVFMDVDGIAPGADFWQRIREVLDGCAVVLVVIGDEWLTTPEAGHSRLQDPGDFVRQEIAAALERSVTTIPVRVNGANMPAEHELPGEIAGLCRLNAIELSDTRWRYDLQRLEAAIERAMPGPESDVVPAGGDAFEDLPPDAWYGTAQRRRWPWRRSEQA